MKRGAIFGVFVLAVSLAASFAQAAVITVDVTIKTVNPQARGITVVYKTDLGEKTIELDVSRKAEITVNEQDGTLDSLGPGLKGKVTFDKDLAVVTKIEMKGKATATKAPELVAVSELNDAEMSYVSCLSEDGLTIYWTQLSGGKATIWTATRDDPQSFFTNKKQVFSGGSPTLSSDGLEMVLNSERSDGEKGFSLYVSKRIAADKPFKRPAEIRELAKSNAVNPCLSADGLTLYFVSRSSSVKSQESSMVQATRKDKSSPWDNPRPVPNVSVDEGLLFSPFITADGLHLLCGHTRPSNTGEKGNLMIWTRSAIGMPFRDGKYIEPENLPPLVGGNPKYVAATGELFFSRNSYENKKQVPKKSTIWVVKNFKLPVETP